MPDEDEEAPENPTRRPRRPRDSRNHPVKDWRPEDDEGGTGVREPRRPKPHAPAGAMEAEPEYASV